MLDELGTTDEDDGVLDEEDGVFDELLGTLLLDDGVAPFDEEETAPPFEDDETTSASLDELTSVGAVEDELSPSAGPVPLSLPQFQTMDATMPIKAAFFLKFTIM